MIPVLSSAQNKICKTWKINGLSREWEGYGFFLLCVCVVSVLWVRFLMLGFSTVNSDVAYTLLFVLMIQCLTE